MLAGVRLDFNMAGIYSTSERVAMVGVLLGTTFSLLGFSVPYWCILRVQASPPSSREGITERPLTSISNLKENRSSSSEILDDAFTNTTYNFGLWLYCESSAADLNRQCAKINEMDGAFHVIRMYACMSAMMGCLSVVITLSLVCKCHKGSTSGVGIISFLASICGFSAIGVFANKADTLLINYVREATTGYFGWATVMFSIGSSIQLVASFIACLSYADNLIQRLCAKSRTEDNVSETGTNTTEL